MPKMNRIELEKEVAFVVTEEKAKEEKPPEIDKFALQKLLNQDKLYVHVEGKLDRIVVRCDRPTGKWIIWEAGDENNPVDESKYQMVESAIIKDAQFTIQERVLHGCGGPSSMFTGCACGLRLPVDKPVSAPPKSIARFFFDAIEGMFKDRNTKAEIISCDYLLLTEHCHAEMINPKTK